MSVQSVLNHSFTNRDMTVAINKLPNTYGRLGELGLFQEQPLISTFAEIKYKDGVISILDDKERGSSPSFQEHADENSVIIKVPHFPHQDVITPKDVQNMQAFEDNVYSPKTSEQALAERLEEIKLPHDITAEWYRVQAIKGIIARPRGGVLRNLYNDFGVMKKSFNMELDDPATNVANKCRDIKAYVSKNLRGLIVKGGLHFFVSSDFFKDLITHASVEKFYMNWSNAQALANPNHQPGNAGNGEKFVFGDILWEVYDAEAPNSAGDTKKFIDDGYGHGVPIGAQRMFLGFNAPPDRMDEANKPIQPGAEIYISVESKDHNKGYELDSESNRIYVSTRPDLLVEVVKS